MSTRNIRWNLKELAEDTMVAFLKTKVTGDMRVYTSQPEGKVQYPCVVCSVNRLGPLSDQAQWHDARECIMELNVISEAVSKRADRVEVQTARARNADIRSDVLNAVCVGDLNEELANIAVAGIAFSMAQVTEESYDILDRKYVTVIEVEMIVEPVDPNG